jgi:hypothetical protein
MSVIPYLDIFLVCNLMQRDIRLSVGLEDRNPGSCNSSRCQRCPGYHCHNDPAIWQHCSNPSKNRDYKPEKQMNRAKNKTINPERPPERTKVDFIHHNNQSFLQPRCREFF